MQFLMCVWIRYIAPPAPYDPYAGYPVAQVPMPPPTPLPTPSGYAPIQVVTMLNFPSAHIPSFSLTSFGFFWFVLVKCSNSCIFTKM